MKKTILSLMAVVAVFMFSGCSKPEVKSKNGVEYKLWSKENNSLKFGDGSGLSLKKQLNIAAEESRKRGYSYFVLLNAGVNNLNGFPINTYSELVRYHTLQKRKSSFTTNGKNQNRGKTPLRTKSGKFSIWFKPVGNEFKNSFVSVWSVEQTLRDTK